MRLVTPGKLLHLALDGVAPRAKLNQQRSRRFCKAQEQAQAADGPRAGDWTCLNCTANVFARNTVECPFCKTAKPVAAAAAAAEPEAPGEPEPAADTAADKFDSNCITPGTEFMCGLGQALEFLIQKKMTEDSLWSRLDVVLSGAGTPGEGEHKIMEYIRGCPAGLSHCIYSADADLVFLGLCLHRPNIFILRESPPDFSNRGRDTHPHDSTVYQMSDPYGAGLEFYSIDVLLDYLQLEFASEHEGIKHEFDLDRVTDDIVTICFLLGNDFLPSSPTVEISEGGLDLMLELYKVFMAGGYITSAPGEIRMERLEDFIAMLADREEAVIKKRKKRSANRSRGRNRRSKARPDSPASNFPAEMPALVDDPEDKVGKMTYYQTKLHMSRSDSFNFHSLRHEYIRGIVWTLKYYCTGCCSWSWYYPYHYAPFLSDLTKLDEFVCNFDLATPYVPFEQLLAVLPPASGGLLPAPYRRLMTDQDSPILDFYPTEFEMDLNGKRNDWEAVCLLNFVDEARLHAAVGTIQLDLLSADERQRNTRDPETHVQYSDQKLTATSTLVQFSDCVCRCRVEKVTPPAASNSHGGVSKPSADTGLSSLTHPAAKLEFEQRQPGNICKFGAFLSNFKTAWPRSGGVGRDTACDAGDRANPNASMVLTASSGVASPPANLLGQHVRLWPLSTVGKVVGLLDADQTIGCGMAGPFESIRNEMMRHHQMSSGVEFDYDVLTSLVVVQPLLQKLWVPSGRYICEYDEANPVAFPAGCVLEVDAFSSSAADFEFSRGSQVICADQASPFYRHCGTVTTDSAADGTHSVDFICYPKLEDNVSLHPCLAEINEPWQTLAELAASCGIHASTALWITSSLNLKVKGREHEVGLALHLSKRTRLVRLGYARRYKSFANGQVVFSPRSVAAVKTYKDRYPALFDGLDRVAATTASPAEVDRLSGASVLGPESAAKQVCAVTGFLAALDVFESPLVPSTAALLSTQTIAAVEAALESNPVESTTSSTTLQASQLHPAGSSESVANQPQLGAWVAGSFPHGPMAFGAAGVVVGYQCSAGRVTVEVLMAAPVTTGCTLGGRCGALRGVTVAATAVVPLSLPRPDEIGECPAGMVDTELQRKICSQVEWYLSDRNLASDKYFTELLRVADENDGHVAVGAFTRCPKLKQLTDDDAIVAEACRASTALEVAADGSGIRRRRSVEAGAPFVTGQPTPAPMTPPQPKPVHGGVARVAGLGGGALVLALVLFAQRVGWRRVLRVLRALWRK